MNEDRIKNPNVETIAKIKMIFEATFRLLTRIVIVILIFLLSYLTYYLINKYFNVSVLYKNIIEIVSKPTGLWMTVGVIFSIGVFLSVFKSKQQFWYGIFETAFALASCYFTTKSITISSDVLSVLVALGSTIYLIVRGLSNISDGVRRNYWLKNEIVSISTNMKGVSIESLNNALKDKEVLVDMILSIANFITKFM